LQPPSSLQPTAASAPFPSSLSPMLSSSSMHLPLLPSASPPPP
jgi:hypothetical protein